jgi:hypothetical protein
VGTWFFFFFFFFLFSSSFFSFFDFCAHARIFLFSSPLHHPAATTVLIAVGCAVMGIVIGVSAGCWLFPPKRPKVPMALLDR